MPARTQARAKCPQPYANSNTPNISASAEAAKQEINKRKRKCAREFEMYNRLWCIVLHVGQAMLAINNHQDETAARDTASEALETSLRPLRVITRSINFEARRIMRLPFDIPELERLGVLWETKKNNANDNAALIVAVVRDLLANGLRGAEVERLVLEEFAAATGLDMFNFVRFESRADTNCTQSSKGKGFTISATPDTRKNSEDERRREALLYRELWAILHDLGETACLVRRYQRKRQKKLFDPSILRNACRSMGSVLTDEPCDLGMVGELFMDEATRSEPKPRQDWHNSTKPVGNEQARALTVGLGEMVLRCQDKAAMSIKSAKIQARVLREFIAAIKLPESMLLTAKTEIVRAASVHHTGR